MDDDNFSEEYNTIMAFADDLDKIGASTLTTDDMRKYAAAAESHTSAQQAGLYDDQLTIEDFNV